MNAIERVWTPDDIEAAQRLEAWTTDPWAAAALFDVELFTPTIYDPCCGTGVLGTAAIAAGYKVVETDIYDWKNPRARARCDFLDGSEYTWPVAGKTVLMNPPFSTACQFVETALAMGARKVACFQRWAWWAESNKRRKFWEQRPPARIWACADRATCWLVTLSQGEREFTPDGRRRGGTTTPHAWYIWERGHAGPPVIGKIWKR